MNPAAAQPSAPAAPSLAVLGPYEQEGGSRLWTHLNIDPFEQEGRERLWAQVETYMKREDLERVASACDFAAQAHRGQLRISGEPYVTHPLAVATLAASWRLDVQAIIAALLHDVMEDTEVGKAQIAETFGQVVADMVDGLSKLEKAESRTKEEAQAENFCKMLLAMTSDIRVMLIKLADRLHNMRTLDAVRPDKQRRIALETLDTYAPIANRLGLNALFRELQELSFRYTHPMRYRTLARAIQAARKNRSDLINKVISCISQQLPAWNITAEVAGREKHLYSIYQKMLEKHLGFEQIYDIFGVRIIVEDIPTCYLAVGALHAIYKPVPGKFKDYIALPKKNGYQSLHTVLIGPYGSKVEVQVRTPQMHHVAENGVASHWLYKENPDDSLTLSELQQKTRSWLQSLVEMQSASPVATEFLEHVKIDLFPDDVYVLTPKGLILSLPKGSTPVDFAYAVHTDIGNRAVACRINGELMPLRTELHNGDQVEIISAVHDNPNPAWLGFVRTGKARTQIRNSLRNSQNAGAGALGQRLLEQALRTHDIELARVSMTDWDIFLNKINLKSRKDLYIEIGLGQQMPAVVARDLAQSIQEAGAREDRPNAPLAPTQAIPIRGTEGSAVQLAACCQPIPGDPIIGLIRQGYGLEVHRCDCPVVTGENGSQRGRWIDVEWEPCPDRLYVATLRVLTREALGVLAAVANAISSSDSNIQNVTMDKDDFSYIQVFTIQVRDRNHLAQVLRAVRAVPHVIRTGRMRRAAAT